MDGIGGRVRALLAAKEERGPGLDLGNLARVAVEICSRSGARRPGVQAETRKR